MRCDTRSGRSARVGPEDLARSASPTTLRVVSLQRERRRIERRPSCAVAARPVDALVTIVNVLWDERARG